MDRRLVANDGQEERLNDIYAWSTTDGRDWMRSPITGSLEDLVCVAEDGDRLIALDYGSPLVASTDGTDWGPVGDVPIGSSPPASACVWSSAGGYLQVGGAPSPGRAGSATEISTSSDGVSWSPLVTIDGFELEFGGVAVIGETVILDGFQHDIDGVERPVHAQFRSDDSGVTWSPTSGWPSTNIATDGKVMVAVANGAWVSDLPD